MLLKHSLVEKIIQGQGWRERFRDLSFEMNWFQIFK